MIYDAFGIPAATEELSLGGSTLSRSSIFGRMLPQREAMALPSPLDFEALATKFWRKNAIVYAAIKKISGSSAEPEVVAKTIREDGQLIADDPLKDPLAQLLRCPNPEQDGFEFMELLLTHMYVTGNAFIHKVRAKAGNVVQLELIRPDMITIQPVVKENRLVATYKVGKDDPVPVPSEDMIHFKLPDALDEFWGLSPLFVLAKNGDIDAQATDFLRAYFLNRGVPAGLLTSKGRVDDDDRGRIRHQWKDQTQGVDGWHDIAILDVDVKYEELSTGLRDLRLQPIFDQTETRIAMVFGVPPILLGTSAGLQRSTFSNFEESRRGFWTETLTPLYTRLQRRLTKFLAMQDFGPNRVIEFDLSKVAGLQENKEQIWSRALEGWDKSLFTRNQALEMMDLSPDPDPLAGDVVKLTTGDLWVPKDKAVQFADLVGDVVTDVVQNEIDESTTDRVDGVDDPNPTLSATQGPGVETLNLDVGEPDDLPEVAGDHCPEEDIEILVRAFLDADTADEVADSFEALFPESLELAIQIAEEVVDGVTNFETGVSVLTMGALLNTEQLQSMWNLAKALEAFNPGDEEIRNGLRHAREQITGEPADGG